MAKCRRPPWPGNRRYRRFMKALRLLLAAMLTFILAVLATAAVVRPYADNQRNWLVMGALLAGLALAALLLARPLRTGARALADEWKPRR